MLDDDTIWPSGTLEGIVPLAAAPPTFAIMLGFQAGGLQEKGFLRVIK
jgi:hypothetical protein